jgi:hypothetical protein
MAWQPEEEGLRQLSEYLKSSLSGHDRNKQKEAELVRGDGAEMGAASVDSEPPTVAHTAHGYLVGTDRLTDSFHP